MGGVGIALKVLPDRCACLFLFAVVVVGGVVCFSFLSFFENLVLIVSVLSLCLEFVLSLSLESLPLKLLVLIACSFSILANVVIKAHEGKEREEHGGRNGWNG